MQVTVHLFAQLAVLHGAPFAKMTLGDTRTPKAVVRALADHNPALLQALLQEDREPRPSLAMFAGERALDWNAPLTEGEAELFLTCPIAGG
ncbi:MAG: hypothetical protein DWQ01_05275 [Planctomycetota bacterium]|nr:MAG: hypothetical protein DWQ01_05275 [Planctomycetota bacterium]